MYWQVDDFPSTDPFLAVYEDFDPSNPEDGIVGCNDDSDDNSDSPAIDALWDAPVPDSIETGTGFIADNQWPWLQTVLEPGNYTMVMMPYHTASTEDFDAGRFGATSGSIHTWDPTEISTTYEMWGPEGGIVFDEGLAPTGGVNPSFGLWAGLGIIGVGIALAVARRREQRV
jgi:hypothetical protein